MKNYINSQLGLIRFLLTAPGARALRQQKQPEEVEEERRKTTSLARGGTARPREMERRLSGGRPGDAAPGTGRSRRGPPCPPLPRRNLTLSSPPPHLPLRSPLEAPGTQPASRSTGPGPIPVLRRPLPRARAPLPTPGVPSSGPPAGRRASGPGFPEPLHSLGSPRLSLGTRARRALQPLPRPLAAAPPYLQAVPGLRPPPSRGWAGEKGRRTGGRGRGWVRSGEAAGCKTSPPPDARLTLQAGPGVRCSGSGVEGTTGSDERARFSTQPGGPALRPPYSTLCAPGQSFAPSAAARAPPLVL